MTKIIIELCQNHLGNRDILLEMIEEGAKNGADYIKMQSIFSEDLTNRERFEEGETTQDGKTLTIKRPYMGEFERLKPMDLSISDHLFFIEECKKRGVIPLTTIFSRGRVKEIGELPWPEKTIKVASYDCASHLFLEELAEYFDNFIISTGATFDDEIIKTAELMKKLGKRFTFLHCVTSYPNTLEMANLKRMDWLKQFSEKAGWSDHTLIERDRLIACKSAIYLGSDFIERHFTIQDSDKTKDGPVSITPQMLKELSDFRNLSKKDQKEFLDSEYPDWEKVIGVTDRELTDVELLNRDYYRGRFATKIPNGWKYNWEE